MIFGRSFAIFRARRDPRLAARPGRTLRPDQAIERVTAPLFMPIFSFGV